MLELDVPEVLEVVEDVESTDYGLSIDILFKYTRTVSLGKNHGFGSVLRN